MRIWIPDACYPSVFEVDWAAWHRRGTRAVLFDLDNTLGPWGLEALPPRTMDLLRRLSDTFRLGVLSNRSRDHGKLKDQLGGLPLPFPLPLVFRAGKPRRRGYLELLAALEVDPDQALMVGDQLFTDIWGAKRLGMASILVEPVDPQTDPWWTRLRRPLERALLTICGDQNPTLRDRDEDENKNEV